MYSVAIKYRKKEKNSQGNFFGQKKSFYFFIFQDLPSFTTNLHRFIGDLRYYKICNASLPAGSVSFNMWYVFIITIFCENELIYIWT